MPDLRELSDLRATFNRDARLTAFKSFSRWLFRTERMRTDPMMQVPKLRLDTDQRHRRRALTDNEIARLIAAAGKGRKVMGMSGKDRAMLYWLALETGLRVSELRSLTLASFDLANSARATVTVQASFSKHRREDVLPIRRDLAEALAAFLAEKAMDAVLFKVPEKASKMLQVDLKAAWIPYQDEQGRFIDFHGLRHSFISRLARSGIMPAVAKDLARHSTITLTMDHYTHTEIDDRRNALNSVPTIVSPLEQGQAEAV